MYNFYSKTSKKLHESNTLPVLSKISFAIKKIKIYGKFRKKKYKKNSKKLYLIFFSWKLRVKETQFLITNLYSPKSHGIIIRPIDNKNN